MKNRVEQYKWMMSAVQQLLLRAEILGYPVIVSTWRRTREEAERNAEAGTGIANSKHLYSLAIDVWVYTDDGKDYIWPNRDDSKNNDDQRRAKIMLETLGRFWENIGGTWGGNFSSLYDPYHFEIKGKIL